MTHAKRLNKNKEKVVTNVFRDTVYDNQGRVVASTVPYFEGEDIQWNRVEYDVLGRVVKESQPSPRGAIVTTTEYNGFSATTHSPKGHTKTIYKNALDQTIKVVENDGSEVEFSYDALGNLVKTVTNGAVSSKLKYDEFSRKVSMEDQTLGKWSYDYNAFGELVSQTDAKGETSRLSYDKLGRVVKKVEGGKTTTFTYDTAKNGKGKLASSDNGEVRKTYEYDSLGRLTTKTQSIDDQHFETNYAYNSASQISQIAYPSGLRMKYEYDMNGLIKSVGIPQKDIWTEEFLNLEEDLVKIARYIEELEKNATHAEERVQFYQDKAEYYSQLMETYSTKGDKYAKVVEELEQQRREITNRFNQYARKARAYREKANYFNRYFRNIVFTYVRSAGGYNYYRYQRCTSRNWKGHCKSYANYNFAVEKEVSTYTKHWSWKGRSFSWSGPFYGINLSYQYSKWASIYERRSQEFETKRREDLQSNATELEDAKKERDWYQKQARVARDNAKYYADLAAKEVQELKELNRKLESQRNAFVETQEQIEAIELDDSVYAVWAVANRNAKGQIEAEWYGNGYLTTRYYNADNTIDQIKTGVGKTLIRDIRYSYDARNNIVGKVDAINGTTESYSYDNMDRISSWEYNRKANEAKKLTALKMHRVYRYDANGNMVFKTGIGDMFYNDKNQIVSSSSSNDFSYDANGNMLSGNSKTYSYNAFNKVKQLNYQGGYQTFSYDESNELVKKVVNNEKTIYYVGKDYELELKKTSEGVDQIMRHNVIIDGKVVAVHKRTIKANKRKADKTAYIHKELLGSVDTVTDNTGAIVYRNEFTPYGENIANLQGNNSFKKRDLRGFTGHRQIAEANIINMNARLYDPELGRFTSADTMIPDPLNAMAYNRYMYVYGNPIKYEDPSGHFGFTLFAIGAAIFTVGATTDDPTIAKVATFVGSVMMGGADMGLSATAQGAVTGFTTSFISTGGDLEEGVQGAITSAISAGLAEGIGHGFDGSGEGYFASGSLGRMASHGLAQGFVSKLRGQSFRSGFISGFIGSATGRVTEALGFNGRSDGDRIGSTAIVAIFGGLASEATGGDFAEGALRAAFVHLYNDILDYIPKEGNSAEKKYVALRVLNTVARTLAGQPLPKAGNAAEKKYVVLKYANTMSRAMTKTYLKTKPFSFPKSYYRGIGTNMFDRMTGDIVKGWGNAHPAFKAVGYTAGFITLPAFAYGGEVAYYQGMANPELVYGGIDFAESIAYDSPASSFAGASGDLLKNIIDIIP